MSTLDLVRSLRRALAELRASADQSAADRIAHRLARELETRLAIDSTLSPTPLPLEEVSRAIQNGEIPTELGMAVCA
jgi:hypothetical protein